MKAGRADAGGVTFFTAQNHAKESGGAVDVTDPSKLLEGTLNWVGIGFPPSWTGGSMVTSLAPNSPRMLQSGMVFHAHSWFTNTGRGDDFSYFISNTVMLAEGGSEVLTHRTPETLLIR